MLRAQGPQQSCAALISFDKPSNSCFIGKIRNIKDAIDKLSFQYPLPQNCIVLFNTLHWQPQLTSIRALGGQTDGQTEISRQTDGQVGTQRDRRASRDIHNLFVMLSQLCRLYHEPGTHTHTYRQTWDAENKPASRRTDRLNKDALFGGSRICHWHIKSCHHPLLKQQRQNMVCAKIQHRAQWLADGIEWYDNF